MKHSFTKYQKNAHLGALFLQNPRRIFNLFFVGLLVLMAEVAQAQVKCQCTDYMYLNDQDGFVHKFKIGSNGTFTEIKGANGSLPWFPLGGGLSSPHGLGQDLNGNIYIGNNASGPVRKLTCDGVLLPQTGPTGFSINDGGYNFRSKDGILYVNSTKSGQADQITAYEICNGNKLGYIKLNGIPSTSTNGDKLLKDWGFSITDDGTFYVSAGWDDKDRNEERYIFRFKPSLADFTNHTTYTRIFDPSTRFPALLDNPNTESSVWGITSDPSGNIYLVVNQYNISPWRTWILKYNSNGQLIDSAYEEDSSNDPGGPDLKGYEGARGIVYYPPTNTLYLAANGNGDCIAKVDAATLNYLGASVGNVPSQDPKGLAYVTECCPMNSYTKVDTAICGAAIGKKYYLQNLIGACKAPICGTWVQNSGSGFTFDECDNSITITGTGTCGTFTLSGGGGVNSQCSAFTIVLTVCTPETSLTGDSQKMLCEGSTGPDIKVQTNQNSSNLIRFVRFTTDQMANSTPTAIEAQTIYAGATIGTPVTPSGNSSPYTATLTGSAAGWSSLAPGTYYVYAIYNASYSSLCDPVPVQEIVVTIVEKPVITTTSASICLGATINLANLVTGNTPAGTLSFYTSSAAANAASNALANATVAPGVTTTYYVRSQTTSTCYAIAPIKVNVSGLPVFSVTDGSICAGGSINLATLVTNTSGGILSYYTSLAAAQNGAPALAPTTVSPTSATNYYVRSTNSSGCYLIKELTVSILPQACGTILITGPGNN